MSLARSVKNSQSTPLEKLQAEDIALRELRDFAEIKTTKAWGEIIDTEYNVPKQIPIQLNAGQEAIANSWIVLIPIGIINLPLGLCMAVASDEDEEKKRRNLY